MEMYYLLSNPPLQQWGEGGRALLLSGLLESANWSAAREGFCCAEEIALVLPLASDRAPLLTVTASHAQLGRVTT